MCDVSCRARSALGLRLSGGRLPRGEVRHHLGGRHAGEIAQPCGGKERARTQPVRSRRKRMRAHTQVEIPTDIPEPARQARGKKWRSAGVCPNAQPLTPRAVLHVQMLGSVALDVHAGRKVVRADHAVHSIPVLLHRRERCQHRTTDTTPASLCSGSENDAVDADLESLKAATAETKKLFWKRRGGCISKVAWKTK